MEIKKKINQPYKIDKYFPLLDTFRGMAAFLVVFSHVRNFFWIDFKDVINPNVFVKALYLLSSFGHESVLLFFVLSGCVVGRIPLDAKNTGKPWSWLKYFYARLTRLWIVLIPALILTWILDSITLSIAPAESFVFIGGRFAHMAEDQVLNNQLNPAYFFGNILFLQTILCPTFGSNGALWSLANEFWYYIIFPLLYIGIFISKDIFKRFSYLIVAILLLVLLLNIAKDFPVWLMGVLAYYLSSLLTKDSRAVKMIFLTGIILTVFGVIIVKRHFFHEDWTSYILSIPFFLIIMSALKISISPKLTSLSAFFSKFSFSLYVIHCPVLTLITVPWITHNEDRLAPNLTSTIILISVVLFIYLSGWIFYNFTEKNTEKVRTFFFQYLPIFH